MENAAQNTLKERRGLTKKQKDYIFVACMLLIPVINFIIFWVVVNFNSILMAFQRLDYDTGLHTATFQNFEALVNLFKTEELKVALTNTLLTSGLLIFVLLPWGFFLTYFLYKKVPLTGFWRVCLFLPTILPAVFLTGAFKYAVEPLGPIGQLWEIVFNETIPTFAIETTHSQMTILAYYFWTNFGGQFILFTGAMTRIPDQILEAGQLDGAGMWVELIHIVFPMCWSTFSMLLILNIAGLFNATAPILLLTKGAANTSTISYWIFANVNGGSYYIPSALGIACTLIIFPIVVVARWGFGKIYADVEF